MKCTDCKNYEPKEPEPVTKVTVWAKEAINNHHIDWVDCNDDCLYEIGTYTFSGTPDIDRVIRETLGKGALAVKISTESRFEYPPFYYCNLAWIWEQKLGVIEDSCTQYKKHFKWSTSAPEDECSMSDKRIETAITEYLKEDIKAGDIVVTCDDDIGRVYFTNGDSSVIESLSGIKHNYFNENLRKATRDEVLDWFTVEVDGNRFIAYINECVDDADNVLLQCSNGQVTSTSGKHWMAQMLINDFLKTHNIIPIPYEWWSKLWEEPQYPRKG